MLKKLFIFQSSVFHSIQFKKRYLKILQLVHARNRPIRQLFLFNFSWSKKSTPLGEFDVYTKTFQNITHARRPLVVSLQSCSLLFPWTSKLKSVCLLLCSVLPGDDWFMDVAQEVVGMISGRGRAANGDREINSPTASVSAHSMSSFRSHGSS